MLSSSDKYYEKKPVTLLFGFGKYPLSVMEFMKERSNLKGVVVPYNRSGPNIDMVRETAETLGVKLFVMPSKKNMEPFVELLTALAPDLIVVFSFTLILPPEVLRISKLGCINIHAGLLPEYRGPHVLNWAIVNGEEKTGVTIHHMEPGIDTGDIIARREFRIKFEDNARTVQEKLRQTGGELLAEYWNAIIEGKAPRIEQDHGKACYYPKRTPEDGLIDWSKSAMSIYNLVRALVEPWPGAYTCFDGEKMIIWKALPVFKTGEVIASGTIARISDEDIYVSTGEGLLLIKEVEYMSLRGRAQEFVKGYGLREGVTLDRQRRAFEPGHDY